MEDRKREKVRMPGGRIRVVLPDDELERLTTLAMKQAAEAADGGEESDGGADE